MNILIKISSIILVFLFLSLILKKYDTGFSFFLRISVLIFVFLLVSEKIGEVISNITEIFSLLPIDNYSIVTLFKVAFVAIISDILSDILRDNNENALARVIEITSKTLIMILSLPMMNALVAFCMEIIN